MTETSIPSCVMTTGYPARPTSPSGWHHRILTFCLDVGGSITGEHGVGADKAEHMPKMFSETDLDTMQLVRCGFDPKNLCNPGKVFPTPRLCGEVPGPYRAHPAETAGLAERA